MQKIWEMFKICCVNRLDTKVWLYLFLDKNNILIIKDQNLKGARVSVCVYDELGMLGC